MNARRKKFVRNPEVLPNAPGAYLLKLRLSADLTTRIRRLGNPKLGRGTYVYAGSASGPGGIRARCRRHLLTEKPTHWHIDHLTGPSADLAAAAFPDDDECRLIAVLSELDEVIFPVRGFGSSDCTACPSHLMKVPARLDVLTIFNDVR